MGELHLVGLGRHRVEPAGLRTTIHHRTPERAERDGAGGLTDVHGKERLERELPRTATTRHYPTSRSRFTISIAVTAASPPLLPILEPARSTACSMVSVVSTPKITGTLPPPAAATPFAASPAT